MKTKILSIVFSVALGSILLTGCMKNEESDSVLKIRDGYAGLLKAQADLQQAEADQAKAAADFSKAQAALENAKADYQKILNQIKAGMQGAEIDLARAKADSAMAVARAAAANAEADRAEAELRMAKAQAQLTANTPAFHAWDSLSKLLFGPTGNEGFIAQRTATVTKLTNAYDSLVKFDTVINVAEWRSMLVLKEKIAKDSVERLKTMADFYSTLVDLSVEELQEKGANALEEYEKALQDSIVWAAEYARAQGASSLTWCDYNAANTVSTNIPYTFSNKGMRRVNIVANGKWTKTNENITLVGASAATAYAQTRIDTLSGKTSIFPLPANASAGTPSKPWLIREQNLNAGSITALNTEIIPPASYSYASTMTAFSAGTLAYTQARSSYETELAKLNALVLAIRGEEYTSGTAGANVPINTLNALKRRLSSDPGAVAPEKWTELQPLVSNIKAYLKFRMEFDFSTSIFDNVLLNNAGTVTPVPATTASITAQILNSAVDTVFAKFLSGINNNTYVPDQEITNPANIRVSWIDDITNIHIPTDVFRPVANATNGRIPLNAGPASATLASSTTTLVGTTAAAINVAAVTTAPSSSTPHSQSIIGQLLWHGYNTYGAISTSILGLAADNGYSPSAYFEMPWYDNIQLYTGSTSAVVTTDDIYIAGYQNFVNSMFVARASVETALNTAKFKLEYELNKKDALVTLVAACQTAIDDWTKFKEDVQKAADEASGHVKALKKLYDDAVEAEEFAEEEFGNAKEKVKCWRYAFNLLKNAHTGTRAQILALTTTLNAQYTSANTYLSAAQNALSKFDNASDKHAAVILAINDEITLLTQAVAEYDALIAAIQAKMAALLED